MCFTGWVAETKRQTQALFVLFEYGAQLANVVHLIAKACMGNRRHLYSYARQEQQVTDYLRRNECLLLPDNFESVCGHTSESETLLNESELEKLLEVMKRLPVVKVDDRPTF